MLAKLRKQSIGTLVNSAVQEGMDMAPMPQTPAGMDARAANLAQGVGESVDSALPRM